MAKGRAEGELEAHREFVMRTIRSKFGEIPEAVAAQIDLANRDELLAIFDRVITAKQAKHVLLD